MYGHERSLVKKLADKPFALLGVNTDPNLKVFQTAVKENNLNWRSFYDGRGGPIVSNYSITGFPTIMLIDENGVIQHINPGRTESTLDATIEDMLSKLEP